MKLRLKEGWSNFFASGFLAGFAVLALGLAVATPGLGWERTLWDYYLFAIVMILLSIFNFVLACRVKN